MHKIEGTELDYSDADAVALDYYLGSKVETKDQWAQRVWAKCAEYKATNGMGYDNKGMESVYKRCPYGLWEEKKIKRREKLMQEFHGKRLNPDEKEFLATCDKQVKEGKRMCWSVSHCDDAVIETCYDARYKTRDQRDAEEEAERKLQDTKRIDEISAKVAKLKGKGFDDETIRIIYPQSIQAYNKEYSPVTRGKK